MNSGLAIGAFLHSTRTDRGDASSATGAPGFAFRPGPI